MQLYLGRGQPAVVLPARPPARDAAEARRQDITDLRLLPDYDRSFSPQARRAFADGTAALLADGAALSEAEFALAVSRLVALAGNAHTSVDKVGRVRPYGRAPVRFAWFTDGLYIVRATREAQALLGRRVVAIDGRPVAQLLADLSPFISGTAERARDDSPPLMECPAVLHAIWPDADEGRLAITLDDGTVSQLDALSPAPDPFTARPILAIAPAAILPGWRTVLDPTSPPLTLREPERVAFSAPLDADGLYVRINANANDSHGPLIAQLAAIAGERPAGGWRRIVLDLRFNDGGDELKTMNFTKALPDLLRPDGSIWIVTGNATFSAGIITAARAKYLVGRRAHIVGESVGDHNPFWTDGGPPFVLRNSAIAIGHAYLKQDWSHGCRDLLRCSPIQLIYGVAAGDLSPEVTIGWSFADYAAGRDTVLEKVLELAR